jgi:hypothetical protein
MAQPHNRIKVTLTLPADIVRAYRIQAARQGVHDNTIVEDALRAHLSIGLLEELPKLADLGPISDTEAKQIAVETLKASRAARKSAKTTSSKRLEALKRVVGER